MKPILKWVGGKRQLLPQIKKNMPKQYNNYIEPFVGGGAVFFDLEQENSIINDFNHELINLYTVIKEYPEQLIETLTPYTNDKETFYRVRSMDRNDEVYNQLTNIERAARILFLNKTCYNGLYRVNMSGQLNAPFGNYKNPLICDNDLITEMSRFLNAKNITILNGDFTGVRGYVQAGDFVYFDPPYIPLTASASFTGYTMNGFDMTMQQRLVDLAIELHELGAYVMISNSYCPAVKELYSNEIFNIRKVKARRNINSKGDGRGKIYESLITNY